MSPRQLALFDPKAATLSEVGLEFHRDLTLEECIQGAQRLAAGLKQNHELRAKAGLNDIWPVLNGVYDWMRRRQEGSA